MRKKPIRMLIYIPAYTDYLAAVDQAEKCRAKSQETTSNPKWEITIAISINSITLHEIELNQVQNSCDKLYYLPQNIGADTNINLGFLRALEGSFEYFWLLSTNDFLKENAIEIILGELLKKENDLLIIAPGEGGRSGKLQNVFLDPDLKLPLGLISSVIYRTEKFKEPFADSLKFAWTGWGQLSVIQQGINNHNEILFNTIEESNIYSREVTKTKSDYLDWNRSAYRHSFFGYPLIAGLIFQENKKLKNEITRKWLYSNWYKISFFKSGKSIYKKSGHSSSDVFWTEMLSKSQILHSSKASPFFYWLGSSRIPLFLSRYQILNEIKRKLGI